jgi:hypothetical protein
MKRLIFSVIQLVVIGGCSANCPLPEADAGAELPEVACADKDNMCDGGTDTNGCDSDVVIAACEYCKANGCPQADPLGEPCHYSGVTMYTDMLGCLQADGPQANCPACAGITFGMPITEECATCAAPFTTCSLSCAFEASGGK